MRLVTTGKTYQNLGTVLYLNTRDIGQRYSGPLPDSFSVISHVSATAALGVRLRSYFLDGGRNVKGVPCFVYHVCRNRITDNLDELKSWLRLNGYREPVDPPWTRREPGPAATRSRTVPRCDRGRVWHRSEAGQAVAMAQETPGHFGTLGAFRHTRCGILTLDATARHRQTAA